MCLLVMTWLYTSESQVAKGPLKLYSSCWICWYTVCHKTVWLAHLLTRCSMAILLKHHSVPWDLGITLILFTGISVQLMFSAETIFSSILSGAFLDTSTYELTHSEYLSILHPSDDALIHHVLNFLCKSILHMNRNFANSSWGLLVAFFEVKSHGLTWKL